MLILWWENRIFSLEHQELDLHHMLLCTSSAKVGPDPALLELFSAYSPYFGGSFVNPKFPLPWDHLKIKEH